MNWEAIALLAGGGVGGVSAGVGAGYVYMRRLVKRFQMEDHIAAYRYPDKRLRHHHTFDIKGEDGIWTCECSARYLDGAPR